MRKVVFILSILYLGISCSVSRKQIREKRENDSGSAVLNICESIVNQNLTARSFYIEKAEFRIRNDEGEKTGLGTIKFLLPDRFLISIKSNTGIEIARISLTGDSIMINDRFNKKLYYGSSSYLRDKYGLTTSLLPIVFGDYVNDEKLNCNSINCNNGEISIDGLVKSLRVKYIVDCKTGKSILTSPGDKERDNVLKISYRDFFKVNSINIPGIIEMSDGNNKTTIEIRIKKLVTPWDGTIGFLPGRQYEKIKLQ